MSARAVDDNVWPGLLPAIATKVGGSLCLAPAPACACALGLRYALMPYVVAQAKDSSARVYPTLRALFFEYPGGPRGSAGAYALQADPLRGRVNWRVARFPSR